MKRHLPVRAYVASFIVFIIVILCACGGGGGSSDSGTSSSSGSPGAGAGNDIIPASRRVDWSQAGIPGGIPIRTTICANVKNAPYNATGDGLHDDAPAIQTAIDACPANQVVYLPEGRYLLNSTLTLSKSHITLRGAGPDKTLLFSNSTTYRAIIVGKGGYTGPYINVTGGYTKGSTSITVADASSIAPGDFLIIDQENDPQYATSAGKDGDCTWCGTPRCSLDVSTKCGAWNEPQIGESCAAGKGICEGGKRTIGHLIKVTAKSGNTLTLEQGLLWNFTPTYHPQVMKSGLEGQYIGIEDLYITSHDASIGKNFDYHYCAYCWMKNVETARVNQIHHYSTKTYRNEFRDNYFHHVRCYTGNYGYAMAFQGHVTSALIENNIFENLASPISFSSAGGGNVVAYNYFGTNVAEFPTCGTNSYGIKTDMTHHGAHPVFNLFEGNVANKIGSDFIWGTTSHHTIFRNNLRGYQEDTYKDNRAIHIAYYSRYFNVVGNLLGSYPTVDFIYEIAGINSPASWTMPVIFDIGYKASFNAIVEEYDPLAKETLLRHGNYDTANKQTLWDTGISARTIPDSLYLTSKPVWWSQNLTWPPYGPDPETASHKIPAQARYENMEWPVCGNGKPEERKVKILVDDSTPGCVLTGDWQRATNTQYGFKNNYTRDGNSGADPGKYATFTPTVPKAGRYDVYFVWQRAWYLDAKSVPVKVIHQDGEYNTIVDQSVSPADSAQGLYLGSFNFAAGTSGKIIVYADSDGYTTVDTIKLIQNIEEACDDGNTIDGDGCSSSCTLEN